MARARLGYRVELVTFRKRSIIRPCFAMRLFISSVGRFLICSTAPRSASPISRRSHPSAAAWARGLGSASMCSTQQSVKA